MKLGLVIALCLVLCVFSKTLKNTPKKHQTTTSDLTKTQTSSAYQSALLRNYMYRDALIFQDVFQALQRNVIEKYGNPAGWNENSYSVNPWNGRRILNIGTGVQSNSNGLKVNIPSGGYDVLWLRVLNDRWATFRVRSLSSNDQANYEEDHIEIYAAGHRSLNEISPDGAGPDSHWNLHQWLPIPLRGPGPYIVHSDKNSDDWISGVAFSRNLWGHARNSAVAYHWALNGGTEVNWHTHNWNNDQLAGLNHGRLYTLEVPVVQNGRDKLLYIVEHNNNWTGTMHGRVRVNGQTVERFRTSWINPFASHFNSKLYDRYMATYVPANLIRASDRFITVTIDMTEANHHIHFREIGTHDVL